MYEPYVITTILWIAFVAICIALWIANTVKNRCNSKKKPKAYAKVCKTNLVLATAQMLVLLWLPHFAWFIEMAIIYLIVATIFLFVWVNTLTNYVKSLINCDKKAEKKKKTENKKNNNEDEEAQEDDDEDEEEEE